MPSKGNGEAGRFDTNSSSEIAQKFCPLHCMLISKVSYVSSLKKLQSFRTSDLTPMGRSSRLLFTEQFPLLTLFIHCFHCQKLVRSSESCKVAQLYFKLGRPVAYQSFCTQGVLRLRKRVTLMVVTVSAILVISWGADVILHMLEEHAAGSVKLSPLAIPIAHTMLMLNSAINPFAYALLNQRFRKKMRQIIRSRSFATRVGAMSVRRGEPQDNDTGHTTGSIPMTQQDQLSERAGTLSQENVYRQ